MPERDASGRILSQIGLPIPGTEAEVSTPADVPARKIDWSGVVDDLSTVAEEALKSFITSTKVDVREFAEAIALCAVRAARKGRSIKEQEAQIKLLAEMQRIRGNKKAWDTAETVGLYLLRTAVAAMGVLA